MLCLNQVVVYNDDYSWTFDVGSSVGLCLELYMYTYTEFGLW